MTMKNLRPKPELPPLELSTGDYASVREGLDESLIPSAFIGIWPSRQELGREMLADAKAAEKAEAAVPPWLQPYVRLDEHQFVADIEQSGLYLIRDISRGICVLDGQVLRAPPTAIANP